jgi:hypothetical protein
VILHKGNIVWRTYFTRFFVEALVAIQAILGFKKVASGEIMETGLYDILR